MSGKHGFPSSGRRRPAAAAPSDVTPSGVTPADAGSPDVTPPVVTEIQPQPEKDQVSSANGDPTNPSPPRGQPHGGEPHNGDDHEGAPHDAAGAAAESSAAESSAALSSAAESSDGQSSAAESGSAGPAKGTDLSRVRRSEPARGRGGTGPSTTGDRPSRPARSGGGQGGGRQNGAGQPAGDQSTIVAPLADWPSLAEYADVSVADRRPSKPSTSPPAATTKPALLHPYEGDGRNLLADRRKPRSGHGWRKLIATLTAGRINPGPSPAEKHAAELIGRIRASLDGVHKVAIVSAKGGVGKSTLTVGLGNLIARVRGDRVIAVDVNANLGDLSARFSETRGPKATIEHVAAMTDARRYSKVRMHTVVNNDRLELLGAQNNPRSSYTLGPQDYRATMKILETHCNVILLDCGTSIAKPLFSVIASDVDALVVVASQDVRGVQGAMGTLEWLKTNGFTRLLPHTIVALNATREGRPPVDLRSVEDQFKKLVSDVVTVPYDSHLAEGLSVELNSVKPKTREALLELAGSVADRYRSSRVRPRHEDDLGTWIEMIR